MSGQHIPVTQLYRKFLDGLCSPEEIQQLLDHFEQQGTNSPLLSQIREQLEMPSVPTADVRQRAEKIVGDIDKNIFKNLDAKTERAPRRRISYRAMAIAAILLLVCSAGVLYWFQGTPEHQQVAKSRFGDDAAPGTNKATLILTNGNKYQLTEKQSGILVGNNGIKYDDGSTIVGNVSNQLAMVATPRGGQYMLTLPDGSKIWLNAASSLKYPTSFDNSKERIVELTGEAYFSIARNKKKPFIVKSRGQQVQVLGTQFNINAYHTEPVVKTTLEQGSIALSHATSTVKTILKPNQQASWNGKSDVVSTVDVSQYIAWKNGEFKFKSIPLTEVLRQLERWYDIEVVYKDIPNTKIHASIKRDKKLSSVLYAIEQITDLNFELSERRLRIKNKLNK